VSERVSVHGALALVQIFFGLHYLAAKLLLLELAPAAWALIRVSSAAALMLLTASLAGRRFPRSPALLGRLALYSIFGVVINQWCFVEGLSRTTAAHSSILMVVTPVTTLLFAVAARRERLTAGKALSFALAACGVLLVLRPSAALLTGPALAGDLLIVANALSYSLFLVLSKDLAGRVDPLAATALLLGFGAVGMLLPGLPALAGLDPASVSGRTWALGAFIVVFPTALGYHLTYWALARVESSRVAFFIFLQPVIATGLAVAFFGERPDGMVAAGAAAIFLAVYLALGARTAGE